jgi:hypothetical protein
VKAKEDLESQVDEARKMIDSGDQAREDLRISLEEQAGIVQDNQVKNQKFQELIIEENKNWNLVD